MATRSKNSLGSLIGVLVMAALLFMLMNVFGYAQLGKFGCGWEPQFNLGAPAAHAVDDGCPESIRGAMNDAEWAAEQHAGIENEDLTAGRFFDEDGMQHRFDSSRDNAADTALKVGRDVGAFPARGRPNVVDHVEVKVAAAMREAEVATGVLVINNSDGPCVRGAASGALPYTCQEIVPRLLAPGATLIVWWQDDNGQMRKRLFEGRGA